MKLRVLMHEAEDGGFWAEVAAVPLHENHPLKTCLLHHLIKLAGPTKDDL